MTLKPNFDKYPDGLVPTIVVDDQTNQVLMMAYMNAKSYQLSLESKHCDEDTLLVRVNPAGPACHTGHTSCFYRDIELNSAGGK